MVDCLQSLQSLKLCFLWFTLESIHRWSSWFISINVDVVLEMHQSVNSSKQYRVHCYINYMHLWSSFGLNDDFEGLKSFRLLHASRELMSQHPSLFPRLAYSDSLFLSPDFTIGTDTPMTTIWHYPRCARWWSPWQQRVAEASQALMCWPWSPWVPRSIWDDGVIGLRNRRMELLVKQVLKVDMLEACALREA